MGPESLGCLQSRLIPTHSRVVETLDDAAPNTDGVAASFTHYTMSDGMTCECAEVSVGPYRLNVDQLLLVVFKLYTLLLDFIL